MTIEEIYDKIKQYALNTKTVESFTVADPYVVWNSLNMKYGAFNVIINNIQREDGYYIYNMTMYYGGKLKNDSSNIYELQQTGFYVIENVVNHLKSDFEFESDNIMTIYPFTQKFADILAGAYADFELIVPVEDECFDFDKEVTHEV